MGACATKRLIISKADPKISIDDENRVYNFKSRL